MKLDPFSIELPKGLRDELESRQDFQAAAAVRKHIESRGDVQTNELANSGRLFKHINLDEETGRRTVSYTGDNYAWMKHFMVGPALVRLNKGLHHRNLRAQQLRDAGLEHLI